MRRSARRVLTLILLTCPAVAAAEDPTDKGVSAEERGTATPTQIPDKPPIADLTWPLGDYALGDPFKVRSTLSDAGITFRGGLIVDGSRNFRGGLDTERDAWRNLLDLNLTFDLDRLVHLPGATLSVDFQNEAGRDGSRILTGDFQDFDNIDEVGRLTSIQELWFEQKFPGDLLRVKIGKVDANTEFAYVKNGLEFIHSSPGFSPTILGLPTYPDPATSINIFLRPTPRFSIGVGVYDGATIDGKPTGMRGPATFFGKPSDLFLIAEADFTWSAETSSGHDGRVGIGAFRDTGDVPSSRGGGQLEAGATGLYLVLDQTLWRKNPTDTSDDAPRVGGFFQLGWVEPETSPVDWHIGAGVEWFAPFANRGHDVAGLMASYVHFSNEARAAGTFDKDFELATEAFHRLQITPWLSLKPDVQYIANPGGRGNDAIVGTIRFEIAM